MPSKIMLVLDNKDDQDFLEKVLVRLKYVVISMKRGMDLSEQLIDHFPDVVFASTLGRNAKILSALGKIKEARGKPKLVFVKTKNEKINLTSEQKSILDGTIYTPIDPFNLIDLLAQTTELDKIELRRRYNEMLVLDRNGKGKPIGGGDVAVVGDLKPNYGETQVVGKEHTKPKIKIEADSPDFYGTVNPDDIPDEPVGRGSAESETEVEGAADQSSDPTASQEKVTLINDPFRKRKYDEITQKLKTENKQPIPIDVQKLRERQRAQAEEIQEDSTIKSNRKHFLKTLFSMDPKQVKKKG